MNEDGEHIDSAETKDQSSDSPQLQKVLSYKVILLITINSIMGTGIFFLPAVGAATAGPASILSWIILSIICIYIAACFAELTSMYPKSGGVYEFCKQAYGYFWSFLIGWTTLIAGNITIAMLVVGAIQYLLPIDAPLIKIPLALFFVYAFNYIAFKGMKTSAVMLVTFAFITIGTLLALIIPGIFKMNFGNFSPFFVFPMSSLIVTIFLISETFFGWETATFLAAETKDGEKVMPKALITSTIVIAVMCVLFVLTSLGNIIWSKFGESAAPLTDLAGVHFGAIGVNIFTILVYLAIIGSVAGWIVSAPRLILAMAEDKLFLKQLAAIHPVNFTPYKAIIFQTILTTILVIVGAGSYETLLHLLVPMVLMMYSAVLLSLVFLRYKKPDQPRYYKVPFGKVGPILIVVFLMFLMVMWLLYVPHAIQILFLALSFMFFGIPIFLLLKVYYDPNAIIYLSDFFSGFSLLIDRFFIIREVRQEIFDLLESETGEKAVEGMHILEFGCGVGTLTLDLAQEVGKNGMVYATDVSQKSIKIAEKRIKKKGHEHIQFIHDIHQVNRVHPTVPPVDAVISIGMLGYIQDIKKVLKEMNRILPEDGKICLVDYVDFFKVIPNVGWLASDDVIKDIFREAGFSVIVKKRKSLFWNYLFIYGIKAEEGVPFV